MNFLLFLISGIFAVIFFVFYKINLWENITLWGQNHFIGISSISGNLLIESLVFLFIGILFFITFSSFSFFRKKSLEEWEQEEYIEKESLFQKFSFTLFLKKYLYYIGFIFFYSSIFLILKSFWIEDFSYFILFLNIIILILFFITSKAELFRDFIKINTILFSLYYIVFYIYSLFFIDNGAILIDIINTLFILSFFIINFYSDSKILQRRDSDSVLVLYFFLYIFIVFSYYAKTLLNFPWKEFLYVIIFAWFIFNIFIYFFLQKVRFLKNSKYVLRALSFLFIYISVLFWVFMLIDTTWWVNLKNSTVWIILFYSIIFNTFVHQKYQNYISFFFSLFTGIFLIYFISSKYCTIQEIYFMKWEIIITFFISLSLVAFTYIHKLKYSFDYFFLHICAYLVNFLWIIYYFYYADFVVLDFWIILLLDSILVFLSYFKLKRIKWEW